MGESWTSFRFLFATANIIKIPFNRRPGTDVTSKNLLNNATVKDIVITTVAGVDGDIYLVGDCKWQDGSRSNVVYTPKNNALSPIIIDVQHTVNLAFINRAIKYCILAYKRHDALPIVVIFCINNTSGLPENVIRPSTVPGGVEIHCALWAEKCVLVNLESLKMWIIVETLHPFVALSHVLINQESCEL